MSYWYQSSRLEGKILLWWSTGYFGGRELWSLCVNQQIWYDSSMYRYTLWKGVKARWHGSCHSWRGFGTSQCVNLWLSGKIGRSDRGWWMIRRKCTKYISWIEPVVVELVISWVGDKLGRECWCQSLSFIVIVEVVSCHVMSCHALHNITHNT